jgi:hypothetical protein
VTASAIYEAHVEPDMGFRLPGGEAWRGYRVKYRVAGTRGRWHRFLLEMDPDRKPTVEELQLACDRHAKGPQS